MNDKQFSLDDVRALLEAAASAGNLAKNADVETLMSEMSHAAVRAQAAKALATKGIETETVNVFGNEIPPVAFLFDVAERVSEFIPVTAGDPNGGNKNTKADRHMLELPTPQGRLQIHLYRD